MMLLIPMFIFFMLGAVLGVLWKWRVWQVFALMAVVPCLGSLYIVDLPPRAAVFNDLGSFFWLLLNYGIYVGLVVGAGESGTLLGMLATKMLGKRRKTPPAVPPKQV